MGSPLKRSGKYNQVLTIPFRISPNRLVCVPNRAPHSTPDFDHDSGSKGDRIHCRETRGKVDVWLHLG
jgi:hypothetical protein